MSMSIDVDALRSLGNRHRVTYNRGHILYHEGNITGPLYVVLRGSVAFRVSDPVTGGERLVETVRAGDFFGEVSCFSGSPRPETAVAQEDGTILLVVEAESAFSLLAASPRFGTAVIRRLCERVRIETQRNLQLSQQVVEARTANEKLVEAHAALEQTIARLQDEGHMPKGRVDLGALAEGMAQAARAAQRRGQPGEAPES